MVACFGNAAAGIAQRWDPGRVYEVINDEPPFSVKMLEASLRGPTL